MLTAKRQGKPEEMSGSTRPLKRHTQNKTLPHAWLKPKRNKATEQGETQKFKQPNRKKKPASNNQARTNKRSQHKTHPYHIKLKSDEANKVVPTRLNAKCCDCTKFRQERRQRKPNERYKNQRYKSSASVRSFPEAPAGRAKSQKAKTTQENKKTR